MAVFVALGAFLMTLAGGWTAQRVTDRRHLVLGLAGGLMLGVVGLDLLPEALEAAGAEVFGVPAALLLFVAGFLVAHLVERLLAVRQAAHGAEEHACAAADRAHPGHRHHAGPDPDGPGHDGPGHDGTGHDGPGHDGTGHEGAGHDGPGHDGTGHEGAGHEGAGHDGTGHQDTVAGVPARQDTARHGTAQDGRAPEVGLTAAAAMVFHSAMDGVAIGAAFQVGGGMGLAVALAVIAHDFADGFNTYTITSLYGNARRKALAMLFADAAAPIAGAASTTFVTIPEQLLGGYLGFFGGALLYLAAAEILPEAHHEHPARSTVLCTIAGAAFIWLVVGLAA